MSEAHQHNTDTGLDRIRSKADYERFVAADLAARGQKRVLFCRLRKPVLAYQLMLRRLEYLKNVKRDPISRFRAKVLSFELKRMGVYLGILISPNICGPGLIIRHQGALTVSDVAQIGANLKINAGVNVTGHVEIGDNVTIGPGASISGDIKIGDGATIAPNSLVIADVPDGATAMGVPAKIVFRPKAAS